MVWIFPEKYSEKRTMTNETILKLKDDLRQDEGKVNGFYLCPTSYLTFGVGHNTGYRFAPELTRIAREHGLNSNEMVEAVFDVDVNRAISQLPDWTKTLTEKQQRALANMLFQLGISGFLKFNPTWEYLKQNNLSVVKERLLASLWAKQTPKRAMRVIKLLTEK